MPLTTTPSGDCRKNSHFTFLVWRAALGDKAGSNSVVRKGTHAPRPLTITMSWVSSCQSLREFSIEISRLTCDEEMEPWFVWGSVLCLVTQRFVSGDEAAAGNPLWRHIVLLNSWRFFVSSFLGSNVSACLPLYDNSQ